MAAGGRSSNDKSLPLSEKLVLHRWMWSLFGVPDFKTLAEPLKLPELEGLDENNEHKFIHQIKLLWELPAFPGDILLGYDQNIVHHSLRVSAKRNGTIRWKYFQWLALLFTEIYLDRLFRDPGKLLSDLNAYVDSFNAANSPKEPIAPFEAQDLRKLAYWLATGSGKTLLMHVNVLQYQHYLDLYGQGRRLNRILLLTPNEGLSRQHLAECDTSGLDAVLFSKERVSLFGGREIEIIDIHKLREEMGEKTVAIEAFEGDNLVLVDEGHRGASASEVGRWMQARNRLCEDGFSFEYSATFGQAVKGKRELERRYAKWILFDYSYRHFYADGFGKDYRIFNLADDSDEEKRRLYLTACLLGFYQQRRVYWDKTLAFRAFQLENPLWVFFGSTVNAVRSEKGQKVSDVLDILLFLERFVSNKHELMQSLDRLLKGKPGLLDTRGNEIFASSFSYLVGLRLSAEQIYEDILLLVFNSTAQGALHVENLKGTDGEIALRLGENKPFGLVNVGDAFAFCKLCEEQGNSIIVSENEFSHSLFANLDSEESTVKVLIGAKKFTEGWSSWRVSTMGLMNVGKTEGAEVIQLFGRGVRLKGYELSLMRSSQISDVKAPPEIKLLETLNVFGVRARYMQQFKEYLEEEGLPTNEHRVEFILPVVSNLGGKKLTTIRLKEGVDYRKQGPKTTVAVAAGFIPGAQITLNWYPRVQSQQSRGAAVTVDAAILDECKFTDSHIAFMDSNAIWLEVQRFKNERGWFKLNLPRETIDSLLHNPDWYRLFIPKTEFEFRRFDRVARWQEIAVALIKKYVERYYRARRADWEQDHLEYTELREDDPNFIREYQMLVEESRNVIVENLIILKGLIESGSFKKDWEFGNLQALWFAQHLYEPLLYFKRSAVSISPVSLNEGERDFVLDLRRFYSENREFFAERELYLFRNMSRGRGIGFFEAGNFYPDFIVWLLVGGKQYISFVDPKGIRNLEGPGDPKIRFYRSIKEIERRLGDASVVLNSFIIASTPFRDVRWWAKDLGKAQMEQSHVLFQKDDKETYIQKMLRMIVVV